MAGVAASGRTILIPRYGTAPAPYMAASASGAAKSWIVLATPEGNEFCLTRPKRGTHPLKRTDGRAKPRPR
jgi:hypothetical protein